MSQGEYVQRCRSWITEQLDIMSGLRNANPRDSSFKAWRQNTVTVLQRIWPDDTSRVERFRRIPFSPPQSSRVDGAIQRTWFSRGGNEAVSYLKSLLEVIDRDGVPDPADAALRDDVTTGSHEDDFPVLDLPSGAVRAPAAPQQGDGQNMLSLGQPEAIEPGYDDAHIRPDDAPAPPQLQVFVTGGKPNASAPRMREDEPAPHAPPAAVATPAAAVAPAAAPPPAPTPEPEVSAPAMDLRADEAPVPASRTRVRKGGKSKASMKTRLKDMLGLGGMDAPAPAPVPAPRPVATPVAPVSAAPQAEPVRAPVAAPLAAPVSAVPHAEPAPPAPAPPEQVATPAVPRGIVTSEPRPLRRKPQRVDSLASMFAPEAPAAAAPPATPAPAGPAAVPAHADDSAIDPEAFARATEDFLANSPVLGLQGRPVQRQSDGTQYLEPEAVAVATLAHDIGRFGVPEGARASSRALLFSLAKRLEEGEMDWEQLREGITFAMEFPELARRLLPILLPWLERAA